MEINNYKIRKFLCIICWLVIYSNSYTQSTSYNIKGEIKDKSSGEALVYGNVLIKGTNIGATTNERGYFVIVEAPENLEQELTPILGDTFTNLTRIRRQITSPSKTSEYVLSPFTLSYLGKHRAIVYKVNQEYADLYETRDQDSRNLQEPLTNIENGLGVFTAFASDTVTFTITRE